MLARIAILFCLSLLITSGCAQVAQELDSTWVDNKTVYRKSNPLPPLEIPPELTKEDHETP